MISSIFRVGLAAIALSVTASAGVAEGHRVAPEIQVARVPSWMWQSYKAYRKQPHYRALACATLGRGGFCSWVHSMPTAEYAVERVREHCNGQVSQRYPEFGSCRLYFIGDMDVYGLKGAKLEAAIEMYQLNPNATKEDLEKPAVPPPTS